MAPTGVASPTEPSLHKGDANVNEKRKNVDPNEVLAQALAQQRNDALDALAKCRANLTVALDNIKSLEERVEFLEQMRSSELSGLNGRQQIAATQGGGSNS